MVQEYYLMHKNIRVCRLVFAGGGFGAPKICSNESPEYMPMGVLEKHRINLEILEDWWDRRKVPDYRDGLYNVLEGLGIEWTGDLLEGSHALSLSDHYWICPVEKSIKWEDINYFDNPFSMELGDVLIGKAQATPDTNTLSPDNTTGGWLKKHWIIKDGRPYLIKDGSPGMRQEVFNEAIASELMARMGVDCVKYDIYTEDGRPYSICEDFLTKDTELVTAWDILKIKRKPNHVSFYTHYIVSAL